MNSELITCPNCGQETEYHFQNDQLKHWDLCPCAKQYKQTKLEHFDLQIRRILHEVNRSRPSKVSVTTKTSREGI
jgi:hypothetical protein